ncbi:hypothetical protein N7541_004815 [Penicillium brevicompactum]|uniref:OPA3-like protein n=1 Tax=Penicillium brevicompactum TaxID=5074 RepID=A0A9W9UUB5_PENBR|nr:hypothetical protein N7541_004815 [Penicillium brevicompactum]
MSLTLKLSSLAIRTLSKPIASQIKAQAREHERFRNICVSMAQALHRFDMRLRLGSLPAEAEARKHKPSMPTVKNASETKAAEEAEAKAKAAADEAAKPHHYRIRPLSESKAIESGANFISESFLFAVAGGLILFESWRSRNKESTRREGVEGRLAELEQSEQAARGALVALEKELLQLRAKHGDMAKLPSQRILSREIYEQAPEIDEPAAAPGWLSRVSSYLTFGQSSDKTPEPTSKAQSSADNAVPTVQSPEVPPASTEKASASPSKSQ